MPMVFLPLMLKSMILYIYLISVFKSIKITVTNDLIKFPKTEFKLTALALALEEVVVRPYQLTGYLEIDAKNVPINRNQRYSIPGLPTGGYEAGSRGPSAFSELLGQFSILLTSCIIFLAKNPTNCENSKK